MKPSAFLQAAFGILVTMASLSPARADLPPPFCQVFEGTLWLTPEVPGTCTILGQADTRLQFPDILSSFIPNSNPLNPTCFTGIIEGSLDGRPVTGISYSGLTTNTFPQDLNGYVAFTAATTLTLKTPAGLMLGKLYFRDSGLINPYNGTANEQLVAIAGTGLFLGTKGTVTIQGNEFSGAPINGRFCR